nr:putative ribonuclease H-like domain-containing protein [Tanacetum cinerariifolium]
MGELTFFLDLQVKQKKDGIFISQDKYVAEILRKFRLTNRKSACTPIATEKTLLKDPNEFEDFSEDYINEVNAAGTLVPVVGQLSPNSTNTFSAVELEDITYSDDEDDIYIDDIIFGSTNKDLCKAFEKLMKDKFQMSSMGELTFFLGLQVKQKKDGIFISQDKYIAEILRKFGLTDGKSASTPIDTEKPLLKDPDVNRIFRYLKGKPQLGLWYPKDSLFDLVTYLDSDYAGASLDRKSTTRGCQFLRCRLIFWQCKKQTIVSTSSTEAEYVAVASCCAQMLWI